MVTNMLDWNIMGNAFAVPLSMDPKPLNPTALCHVVGIKLKFAEATISFQFIKIQPSQLSMIRLSQTTRQWGATPISVLMAVLLLGAKISSVQVT